MRRAWIALLAVAVALAVPSSAPAKPANWYPDPWQQSKSRWWDGATWTGQTSA